MKKYQKRSSGCNCPSGSHQEIAELFIKNNIHVTDKLLQDLSQAFLKQLRKIKKYGLTHNYSAYLWLTCKKIN